MFYLNFPHWHHFRYRLPLYQSGAIYRLLSRYLYNAQTRDFFVVYLSSSLSTLSHLSFILLGMLCIAPKKQDSCQMRLTLPSPYRVDFISGTHLRISISFASLLISSVRPFTRLWAWVTYFPFWCKAVVETLSVLSLTPHLYAILVADLGVEPSSPLSESGVQAVIPIGNDKTLFFWQML